MNRNHISAQPPGRPTAGQHKPELDVSTRLQPPAAKAEPPAAGTGPHAFSPLQRKCLRAGSRNDGEQACDTELCVLPGELPRMKVCQAGAS